MTALASFQAQFADALLGLAPKFPDGFRDDGPVPLLEGLSVHRNTCLGGLRDALARSLPTVQTLVGNECFSGLCTRYVRRHPPANACLSIYGAQFADFLTEDPAVRSLPYLADVARLDWALDQLGNEPGSGADSSTEPTRPQQMLDEHLHLQLCERLVLLRLHYPADEIRDAISRADDAALTAIELHPAPLALAIWQDSRIHSRRLSPLAADFLAALLANQSPAEALEQLSTSAAFQADTVDAVLGLLHREILQAPFVQLIPTELPS